MNKQAHIKETIFCDYLEVRSRKEVTDKGVQKIISNYKINNY